MRILVLFCLSLFTFIQTAHAANTPESAYDRVIRTGTLTCGIMLWPPYFEKNLKTGAFEGMGVDLYNELTRLIDLKIKYVEIIVGQQVEELRLGRIDAVCNDGPYVFSSIKFVNFTAPLYYGPAYTYVRADDIRFKNVKDINKPEITFVGIDGDVGLPLAERNFPLAKRMSLPATTDVASLLMNVTTKKADATITDPPAVRNFNAHNDVKLRALSSNDPVAIYPISLSVKKGETDLLNMLNSAIYALWNTGEAAKILNKYDPSGREFLHIAKPYIMPGQ